MMVEGLCKHKDAIDQLILSRTCTTQAPGVASAELTKLQDAKASIHECIQVISKADEDTAAIERRNVFEDITLADQSFNFTISTVGDLVTGRKINLSGGSCNLGGQMSESGFEKALDALAGGVQRNPGGISGPNRDGKRDRKENDEVNGFQKRYGGGNVLEPLLQKVSSL